MFTIVVVFKNHSMDRFSCTRVLDVFAYHSYCTWNSAASGVTKDVNEILIQIMQFTKRPDNNIHHIEGIQKAGHSYQLVCVCMATRNIFLMCRLSQ